MRRVPCHRGSISWECGYLGVAPTAQAVQSQALGFGPYAPVDYRNIHLAAHPWRLVLGTSLVRLHSRISGPKFQEDQQDRVEEGEREREGEGGHGQNVQSRRVLCQGGFPGR